MPSQLQAQLRSIAHASAPAHLAPKARRSVLFERDQADDVDAESVRRMAWEACEELEAADERFTRWRKVLFGHAKEEDKEQLQEHVAGFLRLLAPYYARPAADKVMEHLVRSKEAWFRCADDVLACVLPFHATERFAKVLRAVDLAHSSWRCLQQTQKNRTYLTRGRIVQLAAQDQTAFQFLCREAKEAARIARTGTGGVASFYAVALVETIGIMSRETIQRFQVVHVVIRYVAEVLEQKKVTSEAVAAVFMVVAQLASKASLEREVSDVLLELIGKGTPELLQVQAVYLMAHIAYTQRGHLQELPEKAFNHLVKFRDIIEVMRELAAGSKKSLSLVQLFLFRLVDNASTNSKQAEVMMKVVGAVEVGELAEDLVNRVAHMAHSSETQGHAVAIYQDLVKELESRHPSQVDRAVQRLLKEDGEGHKLFDFFSGVFRGSVLEPMPDTKMSSLAALSSPKGRLRVAALRRLDSEMEQLCNHPKLHELVSNAVIKALQDEQVEVVNAAVSSKFVKKMKSSVVYNLLHARFLETIASLKNSTSTDVPRDVQVCSAVITFLAEHFGQSTADKRSDVLHLLLNHVLVHPRTQKLNLLCIKLLTKLEQELESLGNCNAKGTWEGVELGPGKLNQNIVLELSKTSFFKERFGMLHQAARQQNLCSLELLTSLALNAFLSQSETSELQQEGILSKAFEVVSFLQKRFHIGSKIPGSPGVWQGGVPPESFWEWERSEPVKAGTVLWREIFLSFLRTLPARSASWDVVFYGTTVKEIMTAILSFPTTDSLQPHINALFLATREPKVVLLGRIVSLNAKEAPVQARANALALLCDTFGDALQAESMSEGEELVRQTAPALLVALCAPEHLVRKKALECCKACAGLKIPTQTGVLKKNLLWKELIQMLGKIAEKQVDILHDPEGLVKGMKKRVFGHSSEVSQFILTAGVTGNSSHCKRTLLRVTRSLLKDSEVLSATVELFASTCSCALAEQSQDWALFCDLLQLYTVSNVSALDSRMQEVCLSNIIYACRIPESMEDMQRTQHVRFAVLKALSPQFLELAPVETQLRLFGNMLDILIKDPSEKCRTVCKQLFGECDLSDGHIVHFLNVYPEGGQIDGQARKRTKLGHEGDVYLDVDLVCSRMLEKSVAMLEILQWKHGPFNTSTELVQAVCRLMKHLLASQERESRSGSDEIELEIPTDYCLKLCITVLQQCAAMENIQAVDVDVVFHCVRQTLDKNLRRSSLKLLATISDKNPDLGLHHALDALKVASTSLLGDSDELSFEVAHMVIQAAIPAFAKKGKDVKDIVEVVFQSLSHVPEHRRRYIMSALWSALQTEEDRKVFFTLLMRELVKKEATWARGDASQLLEGMDPSLVTKGLLAIGATHRKDIAVIQEIVSLLTSMIDMLLISAREEFDPNEKDRGICTSIIAFCVTSIQAVERVSQTLANRTTDDSYKRASESLWSLVTLVSNAWKPGIHASCMLDLLSSGKVEEQRIILRMLVCTSGVFESEYAKESQKEASPINMVVETLNTMLLRDSKASGVSALYEPILSALLHLITLYGDRIPSVTVCALSGELQVAEQGDMTASTAAIKCIAQGVRKASRSFIPRVPEFMPKLLDHLSSISGQLKDCGAADCGGRVLVKSTALLEALEACFEHLGPFLNPYISRAVEIILSPVFIDGVQKELSQKATELFVSIPQHVPARLALPTILGLYSTVERLGDESLQVYYLVFEQIVRRLDLHAIKIHHLSIFAGVLEGLDVRRTMPTSIKEVQKAEASCARVCLELVKRLNDSQFSPLVERLLDWAEAKDIPCDISQARTARHTAMFHLVTVLSSSLKAVFAPYYALFFNDLLEHLKGGSGQKSVKRRKVANEEAKGEWEMHYHALQALHNCFLFEDGVVMNQERFELAMPVLVSQCTFAADPMGVSEVSREQMDAAVANCIVQLAVCMGEDSLWKPMNHKLLMHTRSEHAQTRFIALKVIKKMVERLQEEYLIFLPETLPFLAELLEDSHGGVENESREIIQLLEQVSGEDLEQYLKSG